MATRWDNWLKLTPEQQAALRLAYRREVAAEAEALVRNGGRRLEAAMSQALREGRWSGAKK